MKLRLLTILLSISTLVGAGIVFDISGQPAPALQGGTGGSIDALVIDDEGDPVPGAVVAVVNVAGGDAVRSTTGDSGDIKANFPRNGVYILVATIPDGYAPSEDSDSTLPGRCSGNDLRLCITVTVNNGVINGPNNDEQGLLSQYGTRAWFKVIDDAPEPRIHAYFTDAKTGKPLPGGKLSIARSVPGFNFTKTVGGDFLKSLGAATYTTSWTPPAGYQLTTDPSVTKYVARLEAVFFQAEPIVIEAPPGLVEEKPKKLPVTYAAVEVRDVVDSSLVDGGLIRFSAWWENAEGITNGRSADFRDSTSEWAAPNAKLVVSLEEVPPGYVLQSEPIVKVAVGEEKNITFLVRRRPVTGGGRTYGVPNEGQETTDPGAWVGPPTTQPAVSVGEPITTVPETTAPPTTAPPTTAPPTTAPPTTAPPTTTTEPPATTTTTTSVSEVIPPASGIGDPFIGPDCLLPENQVLCMELGLIPPPSAG